MDPTNSATAKLKNLSISNSSIDWAFSGLDGKLGAQGSSGFPSPETCVAHLKLLETFYALKDEIAYTDGLFGLWDCRAHGTPEFVEEANNKEVTDVHLKSLAAIREKRWVLYVARAADRYEVWWNRMLSSMNDKRSKEFPALPRLPTLTTRMMEQGDEWFEDFVDCIGHKSYQGQDKVWEWTADMLPPIDVLMVWHSHMLNPRNYLSDCIRDSFRPVWYAGMPWAAINSSIDDSFTYKLPPIAETMWKVVAQRAWGNVDDYAKKTIRCPRCESLVDISWTTCDRPANDNTPWDMEDSGEGFGEQGLSQKCPKCELHITHDVLKLGKFKRDATELLVRNRPMCGTLSPGTTGLASQARKTTPGAKSWMFPNNLVKGPLRQDILTLCTTNQVNYLANRMSMTDVKELIEKALKSTKSLIAAHTGAGIRRGHLLWKDERLAVRKMMAAYWDNHSQFSMDLSAAVIRQGMFVDKMHHLDWLHSPNALDICKRILVKYDRFFQIVASSTGQIAVPTLDVDLGWHTHQLSPQAYFLYSLKQTSKNKGTPRFVDHDDKIGQETLNESFEWTSKEYVKRFGEVYSECTCWYCEAIRARNVSTVSRLFGDDKNEKAADRFYESGQANLCPPENSAHISTHNSVPENYLGEQESRRRVRERIERAREGQLEAAYGKACKRAIKKGRKPPTKNEFRVQHYGYEYYGQYPYATPYASMYMYPYGLYYMPLAYGGYGACAAGSCGGTAGQGKISL